MEISISIGERLREERDALGKTQSEFAAIAEAAHVPGSTRQSQAKYEKGLTSPSAAYMAAIAAAGADVLYILTGNREGGVVLSTEERLLVRYYRDASSDVRRAAVGALLGGRGAGVSQSSTGDGNVQIGTVGGSIGQVNKSP